MQTKGEGAQKSENFADIIFGGSLPYFAAACSYQIT